MEKIHLSLVTDNKYLSCLDMAPYQRAITEHPLTDMNIIGFLTEAEVYLFHLLNNPYALQFLQNLVYGFS